jgi:hypothetical protein
MPLRCTQCGRTYHYELKRIFANPKNTPQVAVGKIIECKGCGSLETYEMSPRSQVQISGTDALDAQEEAGGLRPLVRVIGTSASDSTATRTTAI